MPKEYERIRQKVSEEYSGRIRKMQHDILVRNKIIEKQAIEINTLKSQIRNAPDNNHKCFNTYVDSILNSRICSPHEDKDDLENLTDWLNIFRLLLN